MIIVRIQKNATITITEKNGDSSESSGTGNIRTVDKGTVNNGTGNYGTGENGVVDNVPEVAENIDNGSGNDEAGDSVTEEVQAPRTVRTVAKEAPT